MKIELTEEQYHNLLLFLNRVDYKGLVEVEAASQIIASLVKGKHENIDK